MPDGLRLWLDRDAVPGYARQKYGKSIRARQKGNQRKRNRIHNQDTKLRKNPYMYIWVGNCGIKVAWCGKVTFTVKYPGCRYQNYQMVANLESKWIFLFLHVLARKVWRRINNKAIHYKSTIIVPIFLDRPAEARKKSGLLGGISYLRRRPFRGAP